MSEIITVIGVYTSANNQEIWKIWSVSNLVDNKRFLVSKQRCCCYRNTIESIHTTNNRKWRPKVRMCSCKWAVFGTRKAMAHCMWWTNGSPGWPRIETKWPCRIVFRISKVSLIYWWWYYLDLQCTNAYLFLYLMGYSAKNFTGRQAKSAITSGATW